jgi:putative membrane protein
MPKRMVHLAKTSSKGNALDVRIAIVIALYYAIGIIGHGLEATRSYMFLLTPFVLLAGGVIVMARTIQVSSRTLITWCILTYILTFTVEALGVETGAVFGAYTYGKTLGVQIFAVPLVIGLNWVIVVLGALVFAQRVTRSVLGIIVITGVLTVIFDIPLEMVAIRLDYWQWSGGYVPVQNFIAWGIVSMLIAFVYCYIRPRTRSLMPLYYYFIQFIFFIMIDLMIFSGIL